MPYFDYRDIDDLRADIRARGRAVALSGDFAPLAAPVRIGERTAANRLAVHPMEGCDGNADGTPGELTRRRWRRFAEGGAALLWGEATAVVPEGRANPRQLLISRETQPALRSLLEETRAARRARFGSDGGFIVGLQLTHSGRWSHRAPVVAQRAPAIDAVRGADAEPIDDAALERLEDAFAEAAALARDAGFDFVDIKQCHTYLLNELLGSHTREGAYGGTFERRTRFVRNVFAKVAARAPGIALATRLNMYDGVPFRRDGGGASPVEIDGPYRHAWGTSADDPLAADLAEPVRLIGELRGMGLALVNLTMGSPYFNPHLGRPFERPPVDGYAPPEHPLAGVERHLALARAMQEAHPDLPMVGTGYSWLRHFALHAGAASVASGGISIVGLGRGALAYPDFAVDALERGAMDANRACIGVSYCTALMRAKHNDLGQYATGCVPRDRVYAPLFRDARRTEGWR